MISCVICVSMMIGLTGGECHPDMNARGCKPYFHVADAYFAILMIFFDAFLFGTFCYKWWCLITVFKLSTDSTMLIEMVHSFAIQFVLTAVAMISCVLDGAINLWSPNYNTLIVFCVDAAVIASCNFAMIRGQGQYSLFMSIYCDHIQTIYIYYKESQTFCCRYLCWFCKIGESKDTANRSKSISGITDFDAATAKSEIIPIVKNIEISIMTNTIKDSE